MCFEDPLAVLSKARGGYSGIPPAICSDACMFGFCDGSQGINGASEKELFFESDFLLGASSIGIYKSRDGEVLLGRECLAVLHYLDKPVNVPSSPPKKSP